MAKLWEKLVPGWEGMTDEEILRALVDRTARPKPPPLAPLRAEQVEKIRPAPVTPAPPAGPLKSRPAGIPYGRSGGGGKGWGRPGRTGYVLAWKSVKWFFLRRYVVRVDREKYEFTPACVAAVCAAVAYVLNLLGFKPW